MPRALLVAAAASGSGKTLVSGALMALMRERGLKVAPFKVGPDYIDPGHLRLAAGRPCYNLDSWMLDEQSLRESFARGLRGAEVGVVEGVMGLYDGVGGTDRGSSAEVARLLGLPVLLVLSARGVSTTVAALARGLVSYDPSLSFLGVVLTGVGSSRHEEMLVRALSREGLRVMGCVPRLPRELVLPSRHLGLVQAGELGEDLWERLARHLAPHLDLEALLEALPRVSPLPLREAREPKRAVVAVARDRAFSFYYQENLDRLEEAGAELVFFSPLADPLPEAQGFYFGGGYPELWLRELAAREDLFAALRERHRAGAPIWAECGGFMFLARAIVKDGLRHPMVGIVPAEAAFEGRLKALGYRELFALEDSCLLGRGETARGHEFRYSTLRTPLERGFRLRDAAGRPVAALGVVEAGLFASYVHLHLGSHPAAARRFVEHAARVNL